MCFSAYILSFTIKIHGHYPPNFSYLFSSFLLGLLLLGEYPQVIENAYGTAAPILSGYYNLTNKFPISLPNLLFNFFSLSIFHVSLYGSVRGGAVWDTLAFRSLAAIGLIYITLSLVGSYGNVRGGAVWDTLAYCSLVAIGLIYITLLLVSTYGNVRGGAVWDTLAYCSLVAIGLIYITLLLVSTYGNVRGGAVWDTLALRSLVAIVLILHY